MPDVPKVPARLTGVPETLLWTLMHRAAEARRPDAVLRDPWAVALVDAIDFPFDDRFGPPSPGLSQWQALRAAAFDREVRRFPRRSPGGTVVALGEGLETQFWRVDDGRVRWLSVDLPEAIDLRRKLLPHDSSRLRTFVGSALDPRWMDAVDPSAGVLLTARGLLMYFDPPDARRLVAACAARFPGGGLVFDAVPPWLAWLTRSGKMVTRRGYRAPPMPWGMDGDERRRLRELPNVVGLRNVRRDRGRGWYHGVVAPVLDALPMARAHRLSIYAMRFGRGERRSGRHCFS